MAIYDYVLKHIRMEHPSIHTLYEKMDNASCFKNAQLLSSRPKIAASHNFTIGGVIYNEPGDGTSFITSTYITPNQSVSNVTKLNICEFTLIGCVLLLRSSCFNGYEKKVKKML